MEKSKLEKIMELCNKVNEVVISYHCDDGYDESDARKLDKEVNWMLHTKEYRKTALPVLSLMHNSLDLVLRPYAYGRLPNDTI